MPKAGVVVKVTPLLANTEWSRYAISQPILRVLDGAKPSVLVRGLDMTVGIFMDEGKHRGEFFVFHGNSERYQPWPGEEV